MSPNDSATDLLKRVRDYLNAGTEQVWVIYSDLKEVHQYQQNAPAVANLYKDDDPIDAESLFPGLKLITSAFFILPEWAN